MVEEKEHERKRKRKRKQEEKEESIAKKQRVKRDGEKGEHEENKCVFNIIIKYN